MDPTACLMKFLDACEAGDEDEAYEAIYDMKEWLRRDGSLPRVVTYKGTPASSLEKSYTVGGDPTEEDV